MMSWIRAWTDVIDGASLVVVGVILAVVKFQSSPYQRGFFCSDESIRYPYRSSTVPSAFNAIVSFGVPFMILLFIHKFKFRSRCEWRRLAGDVARLFFFGLSTQLVVNILKFSVGRLRPHFLDVCVPSVKLSEDLCGQAYNPNYITDYSCLGNSTLFPDEAKLDKRLLEARLSFPSGHASMAFYGMILAVLLVSKTNSRSLLAYLLQLGCFCYAVMTGASRITDNKHHPGDVLFGTLLGCLAARFAATRILAAENSEPSRRLTDVDDMVEQGRPAAAAEEDRELGSAYIMKQVETETRH